jgi:hypothetical protein
MLPVTPAGQSGGEMVVVPLDEVVPPDEVHAASSTQKAAHRYTSCIRFGFMVIPPENRFVSLGFAYRFVYFPAQVK